MAGDWIKMRTDLASDPAVLHIADMLDVSDFEVVGMLHKFWSWADKHTTDGNAYGVTLSSVDRFMSVTGFGHALSEGDGETPWLIEHDDRVEIPKFLDHNGESAKKRGLTQKRVQKYRDKPREIGNAPSVTSVTQKVLPEKRREEKSSTTPMIPLPETPSSPSGLDLAATGNAILGRTGIPGKRQLVRLAEQAEEIGEAAWTAIVKDCKTEIVKAKGSYWAYLLQVVENHKDDVRSAEKKAGPVGPDPAIELAREVIEGLPEEFRGFCTPCKSGPNGDPCITVTKHVMKIRKIVHGRVYVESQ